MTTRLSRDVSEALVRDGYVRIPSTLDLPTLEAMRAACDRVISSASRDHFEANWTTGSMLAVERDPWFAELIGLPATLGALRELELGQVVWSAGYVISKPAGGPRLFWHQDWLWWNHPIALDAVPHQLFAMFYAVDTERENGCLRVVPGSHRQWLPAHDQLTTAHSKAALSGEVGGDNTMFGDLDGEVDVPVRAGDLLLGDSRLLHAAHANGSTEPRTLVTLWYHPAYDCLPPEIQAYFALHHGTALNGWPAEARNRIDCALPYCDETVTPLGICRDPQPT